jgi:hypothetical protein
MGDHKTKPTLQRGIITLLQGWYDDGTIHFPTGHFQDQQVRQALEEQANIGVYNLLLGRFSKQFIDIQSAYIRYIDKDSKLQPPLQPQPFYSTKRPYSTDEKASYL